MALFGDFLPYLIVGVLDLFIEGIFGYLESSYNVIKLYFIINKPVLRATWFKNHRVDMN